MERWAAIAADGRVALWRHVVLEGGGHAVAEQVRRQLLARHRADRHRDRRRRGWRRRAFGGTGGCCGARAGEHSESGPAQREFGGDASAYGNAELRFFLTRFFFLLPGDLGAFGLADGGRVFRTGEQSDVWHSALGGGLWASFLGRTNTLSVSYARGREGSGFYFRSGLLY